MHAISPEVHEQWADYRHPPFLLVIRKASVGMDVASELIPPIVVWHDLLHSAYCQAYLWSPLEPIFYGQSSAVGQA